MNIPLINTNDKESINTSLIAIKRATEELNNLIKIADEKMAQLDEKAKKYTDDKINALDVASVGGSGKYISAISETDGKINATASDITSTVSSGNSQPVTSGGVAEAIAPLQPIDSITSGNLHPVTSNAVADKISSLDVSSVGGSGKYISAISETDGKINATATDLGNMVPVNSVTSGNMHSVTSGAVASALNSYLPRNYLNTLQFSTPDYAKYVLIADISTWYNSTSPNQQQTYSMNGVIISARVNGNDRSEVANIVLSVGYYRAGNSLPNDNLMHVKMSGVNGLYYRCCIVQYSGKQYLALKILTDQGRIHMFLGYMTSAPLLTILSNSASVTELYVN